MLKDTRSQRETSSKLVIENDGRGPFYHFSFPLGGLQQFSKNDTADVRGDKRMSIVGSKVPDVLPIRLATGKETPLDASSPVGAKKAVQMPTATTATIPPLDTASGQTS